MNFNLSSKSGETKTLHNMYILHDPNTIDTQKGKLKTFNMNILFPFFADWIWKNYIVYVLCYVSRITNHLSIGFRATSAK